MPHCVKYICIVHVMKCIVCYLEYDSYHIFELYEPLLCAYAPCLSMHSDMASSVRLTRTDSCMSSLIHIFRQYYQDSRHDVIEASALIFFCLQEKKQTRDTLVGKVLCVVKRS